MTIPRSIVLFALLISSLGRLAASDPLPRGVDVYTAHTDGYRAFRIPAIEVAPDGTLLAFAEARKYTLEDPGYGKQEIDLVCKRSTDQGATWSHLGVIEHVGDLWASANPETVVDRSNGRVWVFYVRSRPYRSSDSARPGTDDMDTMARWSGDNGQTWSQAIDLTPVARDLTDKTWKASIPGPGGAIQTRTGRLLVSIWKMPFAELTIYSDDHGKTWKRGQLVPGNQGGDESMLVELGDGRILYDMRQENTPNRWMAESTDSGDTWHNLRPGIKVTEVACAIRRLAEGSGPKSRAWVLWTGPQDGKRERLVIRTSTDEGMTFPNERLITDQFSAYSDLAILPDGSVGVLWERGVKANYECITFTHLTREWLAPVLPGRSD